ncbi:MAG TPA: DNA mismatch repair endonuclease MutL [Chloroflexota bacterium]|nr:DNA mismatch repair endonuclease MutL [Chloroflexota bacterium]
MSAPPLARAPIRVLPPRDAERIAAGEVVERPSSVVKELVENALDAGARAIRVEVRGGGLRLVRVVDDGCGIPADEIALAFQRHATSKIRGVDDLDRLATLGFRGEALPSIAAVAELVVLTAADGEGLGYEALVRGGAIAALTPRPRARGTTISVRYLFQTVPARLKFVASARHEVAAIGALVRRYALAYPEVRFSLLLEGRLAWHSSGDGLAATLAEVYGAAVAEALRPLPPLAVGDSRWHGYLGERHVTRPNRGAVTLIVNGRWVEVRELLAAVEAAYRPLLPRGRHPIAVLYGELPATAVDVNVHPAKTEIKFLHGAALAQALAGWVREALGRGPAHLPADVDLGLVLPSAAYLVPVEEQDDEPEAPPLAAPERPTVPIGFSTYAYPAPGLRWYRIAEGWGDDAPSPPAPLPGGEGSTPPVPSSSVERSPVPPPLPLGESRPVPPPLPLGEGRGEGRPAGTVAGERRPEGRLPPLQLLGQVQDALLLCEGPAGLYLVDQHRAHERVLYERLHARHAPAVPAAVEPLVLELRPAQAARLAARLPALAALGFVCEWFGGRSFLVRATPALGGADAGLPDAAAALAGALGELLDEATAEADDWQDRLLISVACHSALRRGQVLGPPTMVALLAALDQTAAPAVCPHGSPLILHLSESFLARQFRWR